MSVRVYRVHVEVSEDAFRKLNAEMRRRNRLEGRGKTKYPIWRIIEDLLNTLPDPEVDEPLEAESVEIVGEKR